MPDPLRPDQWRKLVTWATMLSVVWPLAGYGDEQAQRLRTIAGAVPAGTRLVLVLVAFVLWWAAAAAVALVNLLPLAAVVAHGGRGFSGSYLFAALVNVGAMLASAMMLGCLIACWAAGLVAFRWLPCGPMSPQDGDAALLGEVNRKLRQTAIWVVGFMITAILIAIVAVLL